MFRAKDWVEESKGERGLQGVQEQHGRVRRTFFLPQHNFGTDSPAQFAAPETVFHLGVVWVGLWHPKFTLPHRDLFVQQIVPDLLLCDGAILWQYHRFLV